MSDSGTSSDYGEYEKQAKFSTEKLHLQELNEALLRENGHLRAQFETALINSNKVTTLHDKNTRLNSQIRRITNEKDDISQRLELTKRSIEELKSQLSETKANAAAARNTDMMAFKRELDAKESKNHAKIDSLHCEIAALREDKNKAELENKMLRSKIDKVINSAAHFFGEECSTIDQTITLLDLSQRYKTIERVEIREVKSKKDKKKARSAEQKCQEYETLLANIKKDLESAKASQKRELESMKHQIEKSEEERIIEVNEKDRLINSLNRKIANLEEELAKRKKQLQKVTKEQQPPVVVEVAPVPPKPVPSRTETEQKMVIEQLNERVKDLIQQLDQVKKQKEDLEGRVIEARQEQEKAIFESTKAKNDLAALNLLQQETKKEVESLRVSLLDQEKSMKVERAEKKALQRANAEIESLKSQMSSYASEVDKLQLEREKMRKAHGQLETTIRDQKEELAQESYRSASLRDEIERVKAQILAKPQLTPNDVVPPSAFHCAAFPNELAITVSQLAENRVLTPHSKVQSVLKAVNHYYTDKISSLESMYQEQVKMNQLMAEKLEKFLVDLCIRYSTETVSVDAFMSGNGTAVLLGKVDDLNKRLDELVRKVKGDDEVMHHITELFGKAKANNYMDKVTDIHKGMVAMQEKLQASNKKCQKLKSGLIALGEEKRVMESDFSARVSSLVEKCSGLSDEKKALTALCKKQKNEIHKLKSDLKETNELKEETEAQLRDEIEELSSLLSQEKQSHQAALTTAMNTMNQKLAEKDCELDEASKAIEVLKKSIQLQKTTIAEKTKTIEDLTEKMETELVASTKKHEEEKKNLISSYENSVSQIAEQCEAHRRDLREMSARMADEVAKRKKTQKMNFQLKIEHGKLERELSASNDRLEREKKLGESTMKQTALNLEASFEQRNSDLKNRFEADKRRIFAFVADEFKQFCDVSQQLDERGFRAIVIRARDELTRMADSEAAVKRIAGAGPHQTPEDIVQQLILSKGSVC